MASSGFERKYGKNAGALGYGAVRRQTWLDCLKWTLRKKRKIREDFANPELVIDPDKIKAEIEKVRKEGGR
jgi:hypothetical protein